MHKDSNSNNVHVFAGPMLSCLILRILKGVTSPRTFTSITDILSSGNIPSHPFA